MSGENAQSQEPTMEEILASIRKIISEDTGDEAQPAESEPTEPVLVLGDEAHPPAAPDPLANLMTPTEATSSADPIPEPEIPPPMPVDFPPIPEPPIAEPPIHEPPIHEPQPPIHGLVGNSAAMQAASAFERLNKIDGKTDTSLEMLVANLLRPALKDWLNTHLPGIVEEQVSRELARIRSLGR